MSLIEIYPTIPADQRENVLNTLRGEIVEHEGKHWMSFIRSIQDGVSTLLVGVDEYGRDTWKTVVLFKGIDKIIEKSDVITQDRINDWLSPKYDVMGLYF